MTYESQVDVLLRLAKLMGLHVVAGGEWWWLADALYTRWGARHKSPASLLSELVERAGPERMAQLRAQRGLT